MKTYWLPERPEKNIYIECGCRNPDHLLIMSYDIEDDDFDDLFIYKGLNHYLPFWKRLIIGVRYILGMRNKHKIHFAETVVNEDEVKEMKKFLNEYLEELERSNNGTSGN